MQYDYINIEMFFLIYGFLGFLLETIFKSIVGKRVVISKGFLTNLFCPLYGICGIVIVLIFTLCEITFNSRLSSQIGRAHV